MNKENEDEDEIFFEPDEALILALNEVNDLRELMENQDSEIEKLKKELLSLKKYIKKS
jgi:LytS/YehU family sensor histidine kinase